MTDLPYGSFDLTDKDIGQLEKVTQCIEEYVADQAYLAHPHPISFQCEIELSDELKRAIEAMCAHLGLPAKVTVGEIAVTIVPEDQPTGH